MPALLVYSYANGIFSSRRKRVTGRAGRREGAFEPPGGAEMSRYSAPPES